MRERVKVQRGWKTENTPLAEGNSIQYDFAEPSHGIRWKDTHGGSGHPERERLE